MNINRYPTAAPCIRNNFPPHCYPKHLLFPTYTYSIT